MLNNLNTESDVEQKVIYPLLTGKLPFGLDYDEIEIQTKPNLKRIKIEKGLKQKHYIPDFLISLKGLPLMIVEAKRPYEDLEEAYREACLYAGEINKWYENGLNPCNYILVCDGYTVRYGYWDTSHSDEFLISEVKSLSSSFESFIELFSKKALDNEATKLNAKIRKKRVFVKPVKMLGGKFIQNKQINNTFGEKISIQYKHIFNPSKEVEKIEIVRNAYINVNKHESHINPIDRLIRKKITPSSANSSLIENSEFPKEIISKLEISQSYTNEVLLLIGGVGSGKSTFMTYLREVALGEDIKEKLVWVTLDLNNAPVNRHEIYQWIKTNLITQIKLWFNQINFESLEILKEIFQKELRPLNELAQLLPIEKFNEKLFDILIELKGNHDKLIEGLIHTQIISRNKSLIVVLDNCDKRNLEEQLLMFEVANWIKETIKCIVFLPLRDTTYDLHRYEKPLDTVIKDLTFRIIPPSLEKVLYSRLKYANRLIKDKEDAESFYTLENGMKVDYPKNEETYYIKSILTSLFQNHLFKILMTGLAGSDVRLGIEIFLDFCKSGHITDTEIFKIRHSKGEHKLPTHIISKVFFRGDRLYYKDDVSRIKNLFNSDPDDKVPNPFTRLKILQWLNNNYKIKGPSGVSGFHTASSIQKDLSAIGFDSANIKAEMENLLRSKLIVSETQDVNSLNLSDLVSISTSGKTHLDLLKNIDYLSACSEDTYYDNKEIAVEIRDNLLNKAGYSHLTLESIVSHAKILVEYLKDYHLRYYESYSEIVDSDYIGFPLNYDEFINSLDNYKFIHSKIALREFKDGEEVEGTINGLTSIGIFVTFKDSKYVGYLPKENISDSEFEINSEKGDIIKVKVLSFNESHNKYFLAEIKPNEADD
ncbi:hypothetical protein BWD42_13695 [Sphingobacterium sp. CZ-UAM]|uniref:type I restriction endonuclease n=1 Tax=Sphingobacterium sp. CZ-UAM TaxID=1933868 RepID=UPI0009879E77|nr:type I restriction endonuclease [Sphingobacterium sp. CZ-UAM]OOG18305.1 hypothetical protein BWD42_13695 [Sphingobacterium sp. CZ-UAM]